MYEQCLFRHKSSPNKVRWGANTVTNLRSNLKGTGGLKLNCDTILLNWIMSQLIFRFGAVFAEPYFESPFYRLLIQMIRLEKLTLKLINLFMINYVVNFLANQRITIKPSNKKKATCHPFIPSSFNSIEFEYDFDWELGTTCWTEVSAVSSLTWRIFFWDCFRFEE